METKRTISFKRDWKKLAFEFLSIFVAVISAFALNNWNEANKSRNAEDKILTEIYNGLEKDLKDIDENTFGHKEGLRAAEYFRNILAQKEVPFDSIFQHYLNLTRDFISIQNTSGYETLKSRGLELVSVDSLRSGIISLYEYDFNTLRKLEEDYYEMQFQENYFKEINYIISRNFILNSDKLIAGIQVPLKITKDEEKLFLSYLWKIQSNRFFVLQYYDQMRVKVEKLMNDIKEVQQS